MSEIIPKSAPVEVTVGEEGTFRVWDRWQEYLASRTGISGLVDTAEIASQKYWVPK